MTPDAILSLQPAVLSRIQREHYFEQGYLWLEGFLPADHLRRLRATTEAQVERARDEHDSGEAFDLGPGHCREQPNLRRIRAVVDRDPFYWELACDPVLTDLVADLLGPDVKFHSGKLNYKSAGAGDAVKWHQDIPAWPHTCFSVLTLGVYLEDVGPQQGPLAVVPGSHRGPIFDQRDDGRWTGHLSATDLGSLDLDAAVELTGPAGSVMLIDCAVVHGSRANDSPRARPLLLYVYSSADACAYTAAPTPTRHTGEIVRGQPARAAHLDPRHCPLPPDWSRVGYRSIYAAQQTPGEPPDQPAMP
jgi:hypothetical protein